MPNDVKCPKCQSHNVAQKGPTDYGPDNIKRNYQCGQCSHEFADIQDREISGRRGN